MNWKLIIGLLLIYGGIKRIFDEFNDYKTGITITIRFMLNWDVLHSLVSVFTSFIKAG